MLMKHKKQFQTTVMLLNTGAPPCAPHSRYTISMSRNIKTCWKVLNCLLQIILYEAVRLWWLRDYQEGNCCVLELGEFAEHKLTRNKFGVLALAASSARSPLRTLHKWLRFGLLILARRAPPRSRFPGISKAGSLPVCHPAPSQWLHSPYHCLLLANGSPHGLLMTTPGTGWGCECQDRCLAPHRHTTSSCRKSGEATLRSLVTYIFAIRCVEEGWQVKYANGSQWSWSVRPSAATQHEVRVREPIRSSAGTEEPIWMQHVLCAGSDVGCQTVAACSCLRHVATR